MTEEFTDTVRAYRLRRNYNDAMAQLALGDTTAQQLAFLAIQNYVEALHAQMRIVNRAATSHTAGGSEYWDEQGVISGTLSAIRFTAEQAESNWNAFKEERVAHNKLKRSWDDEHHEAYTANEYIRNAHNRLDDLGLPRELADSPYSIMGRIDLLIECVPDLWERVANHLPEVLPK